MQSIYELITLDVQNEHDLEHDMEHETLYSIPKIYDADGDLTKRWYVYFSYRNPDTGKMERIKKNIYGKANRYKTKEVRYSLLSLYKKRLLKLLKEGFNPFEDNAELFKKRQVKEQPKTEEVGVAPVALPSPKEEVKIVAKENVIDYETALQKAIDLKTNVINSRTLSDYKSRIEPFKKWLSEQHPKIVDIRDVSKKIVTEFLNDKQLNTSARNRNNYRTTLSSIFQTLEDNEIIEKNFIKNISTLKTSPERNRTYSLKQEEEIFKYLEEKDQLLLLFIKFISYNFLRPIEVCRLMVGDINFDEKYLEIKTKSNTLKKKIIPEILLKELTILKGMKADMLVFTPDAIGGYWETELNNRRDYFSKRFKSVVKDHFGLGNNYGLYSFRHTFITKLYRAMSKDSSPYAAKSQLMQITGHSTMTSLEKYLRDIDAELPDDYSNFIK